MAPKRFIWYISFCACSAFVFFLSSFNVGNFTSYASSHGYYAGEILCLGLEDAVCTYEETLNTALFRGLDQETKQVQTDRDGARYVSSSFARLVRPVITLSDTLKGRVLIVQSIKASVASLLLAVTISLILSRRELFRIGTKLLLLSFSLPYLVFMTASVYPAGIAILASTPFLLSLQAVHSDPLVSHRRTGWLCVVGVSSLVIAITNRFEVTAFLLLATVLVGLRTLGDQTLHKRNTGMALFVFSTVLAVLIGITVNPELEKWFKNSLSRSAKVLDQETAEANSKVVERIGDRGFSLLAPITFVDNTTREVARLTAGSSIETSAGFERLLIITLRGMSLTAAWCSLTSVLLLALRCGFQKLPRVNSVRVAISTLAPVVIVVLTFFVVPSLARVPSFFWYFATLLLVLVVVTDERTAWDSKILRVATGSTIGANALAICIANMANGNLHLGNFVLNPTQLSIATLAAFFGAGISSLMLSKQY